MTEKRYAITESQGGVCTVEATFDNYPQAHAAARQFCKQVAERQDVSLDNLVVEEDRVTFEEHGYEAQLIEIDAYAAGETL